MLSPVESAATYVADDSDGWNSLSYPELADLTLRVATVLQENGLRSGDVACVVMPTGFPCIATLYGVWAAGGAFTPVAPPQFGDVEQYVDHIAAIFEQSEPRVVVTSPELAPLTAQALERWGTGVVPLVLDENSMRAAEPVSELAPAGERALLQFTSGSTGVPRGVSITWKNLASNIEMISERIGWHSGDTMMSWLPLYHDMGLVGSFLTAVTNQGDLYLMRPDQFVRDPARWLRAMTFAQHCPAPSFALGYVVSRVRPEEIADLDLSSWRTLCVGAEPVAAADLVHFAELVGPQGFSLDTFTLGYGLAEATLMVSTSARDRPITALRIDNSSLHFGTPVTVLSERQLTTGTTVPGGGWVSGVGSSTRFADITILGEDGTVLPDGYLGEVVVRGESVSAGHIDADGSLHTGDAGFFRSGELFVLGRMGTSLKVRGRTLFMEDVEARLAGEVGLPKGRIAAVAISDAGAQGIALFAETEPGDWISEARRVLRGELGPARTVTIVTGPRGLVKRTSSGKPRRRHMWQLFEDDALDGAAVHTPHVNLPPEYLTELLSRVSEQVHVPDSADVLLEGSIAEGFGNEGSDIDFLVVVPGEADLPTMPTVLFVDGRRVEVRTRSEAQLRDQLERARREDAGEDVLNRCQRFLRAGVVRGGPVVDELRSLLPYAEFEKRMADWWAARAVAALGYALALDTIGEPDEAAGWLKDGLLQAVKSWAAARAETYLETKWLPEQLRRLGDHVIVGRYRNAVDGDPNLRECLELAADLGVGRVPVEPERIRFARMPGVTTWQIGGRVHVVRDKQDVYVLSEEAGRSWRTVVFGQPIRRDPYLARFVELGFVRLKWQGGRVLEPALAMCEPVRPVRPTPDPAAPALGVTGGARTQTSEISLSPLPATRFAECALVLVWSNIVLENAREDLVGALKSEQPEVAAVAAHRMTAMAVRVLLSAHGIHPLPADVAPVATVRRLIPRHDDLLSLLEDATTAGTDVDALDKFVAAVRQVAGGAEFPASFDSRVTWRRTLDIGYDWLRLGGYLDGTLPIDEARDLLSSGGLQPHLRDEGTR
ncbi:AMP-binding protein [Rhodococcus sp. NPDC058521]|uniref:AMP-binding protein n=1 Tax=Rhodococcus sp. NPDC058521 TaxID=3346536 RepID=UPI00365FCD60